MKKLLAKKNNPILELWQNKKFNQVQKLNDVWLSCGQETAPNLQICSGGGSGGNGSGGSGEGSDNEEIDE